MNSRIFILLDREIEDYLARRGDYAYAEGTDSAARSAALPRPPAPTATFDSAFVYGDGSTAFSGGTVADPGTFDSAVVIGNGDAANADGDMAGAGSYDVSYVEGNDLATANAQGAD